MQILKFTLAGLVLTSCAVTPVGDASQDSVEARASVQSSEAVSSVISVPDLPEDIKDGSAPELDIATNNSVLNQPDLPPVGQKIERDPQSGALVLKDADVANPVNLQKQANFQEAMTLADERQKVFANTPEGFSLTGVFSQGGMLFGQTEPGAEVKLQGNTIMVDDDGLFVLGFGRDSALTALLTVTLPSGITHRHTIELEDKSFPEQRIDNLDQSKVSGFSAEQLKKIRADQALFKVARSKSYNDSADWVGGFDWPLTGRISGVFGSRRILNGEPKRPHSGVDVARPTGTPIIAPAGGVVTLAQPDMYFGGGTVLLDHGHRIESAFLHMSRLDVEVGQRVERGEVIGLVGATGRVTGPHLHWSVRWLGLNRLVDPQLLAGDMPATE